MDDSSKVGEARRTAVWLAETLGFDETRQGTAALVVTEAASNLIKHAGTGELIMQGMDYGPAGQSLEVLALDSGRGMRDVGHCAADGYSTAGSSGTGLGGNQAYGGCVCGLFESRSRHRSAGSTRSKTARTGWSGFGDRAGRRGNSSAGRGSLRRRVGHGRARRPELRSRWSMGSVTGSKPPRPRTEAVRVFRAHQAQEPAQIVESIHAALRSTRGAALAIARLDRAWAPGPLRGCR